MILITPMVNFVIALITIIVGIGVFMRATEKLATTYKLIIFAVTLFAIKELIEILNALGIISTGQLSEIIAFFFIALILLGFVNMKALIKKIDDNHNHRRKR